MESVQWPNLTAPHFKQFLNHPLTSADIIIVNKCSAPVPSLVTSPSPSLFTNI